MDTASTLLNTPLHDLHLSLGARMVPFAGYSMPVQYPEGILKEHLHTRAAAGLFDVSHMGQVTLVPRSGRVEDAALALERLVPVDVLGIAPGRQRYGVFTNEAGGILDDLMIVNRGDHLFLVVNASRKHEDVAHLRAALSDVCDITLIEDHALIALQGPKAEAALAALWPEAAGMRFMDARPATLEGAACFVTRSGYSGEDGYEISVPADAAERLCRALLANPDVHPVGLGARDSLRLESGLCLYGNDIDEGISPVEAALEWAMQKVRRTDGARAGGFPGADRILGELQSGAQRRRIGLKTEGRAPVRGGVALFADAEGRQPVGTVTSGGFGPSVDAPVAMGLIDSAHAATGTALFAEVRGKYLPVTVCALPFIPARFKR
ncbi:aminomethyltransferase [Rhizobium sp. RU20A]|uniref:glycine cleavage system aminomethyltransferase GcvT n=1 Tax=Rhizobium sp. RU20A TaxID=1907412 RepID=UPI0009546BAC|nr:glycine cleavage system aminomethyltransferase GcvT [Rhizobium sp. RU20A]SIQ07890.1 aminomethyltransferase [Rhizobium sp. RU20A]